MLSALGHDTCSSIFTLGFPATSLRLQYRSLDSPVVPLYSASPVIRFTWLPLTNSRTCVPSPAMSMLWNTRSLPAGTPLKSTSHRLIFSVLSISSNGTLEVASSMAFAT